MLLKRIIFLTLAVILLSADLFTKHLAGKYLPYHQAVTFIPHFWSWRLTGNEGAAFSFLSHGYVWERHLLLGFALIVSLGFVLYLLLANYSKTRGLAASLILGGALGNALERFYSSQVTDFVDWYLGSYHWPTFNLADCFICLGVLTLILSSGYGK